MKRLITAALLLSLAIPAFCSTHKDTFSVSCSVLWPALKDTLRNSGKYGIIGIDNTEMTASYNIGGFLAGKRINSVILNPKGDSCEMQTQTAFSGLAHNDAGDFRERVQKSLEKLQAEQKAASSAAVTPETKPAAQAQ